MICYFGMKKSKSPRRHKLSIPELMLMVLKKAANAPFEMLLEYGKIRNQQNRPIVVRTALYRLKNKKLIYCERKGRKFIYALTDDGEKEADNIRSKMEKAKPKKWDGKWRVIVFDVPEKLRGKRDLLRRELVGFGFAQLQRSVWIYPHPLPEEFKDLWEKAGILKHCVIFESDKVDNGEGLKKLFPDIIL